MILKNKLRDGNLLMDGTLEVGKMKPTVINLKKGGTPKDKEFKPHYMYGPKGEKVLAKTNKKHLELKDKGYNHEPPSGVKGGLLIISLQKGGKPAKGKRFSKKVGNRTVSYGQAGKAKDGSDRIKPGTSKGDGYCARSFGIKKRLSKKKQNDPNTSNNLSRKKWKCRGKKSKRS